MGVEREGERMFELCEAVAIVGSIPFLIEKIFFTIVPFIAERL